MAGTSTVDDQAVVHVVLGATDFFKKELGRPTVDADVLKAAWLALRDARRTPEYAASLDAAAAEHYLFAAYAAAVSGDPTVALTPVLYETKKRIYFFLGKEAALRTDPRFPVMPPSDDVEAWGIAGARYGLDVYKSLHPGERLQYGAAVGSFAKDAGYGTGTSSYSGKTAARFGTVLGKYL